MTTPIKALPSLFKGITFRSRTEARWAVFFEAIGWNWTHEKEGFDLSGEWYLPDFYLADFPMWFEVKPDETDGSEQDVFKKLCKETKTPGIIARSEERRVGKEWVSSVGLGGRRIIKKKKKKKK